MRPAAPRIVLISGYAQSGKDTFADGMVSYSGVATTKVAFADCLKAAANKYLKAVDLFRDYGDVAASETDDSPINFFDEEFKKRHRHILVELGRFARSLDRDVFVKALCAKAQTIRQGMVPHEVCVIVPDWRYLNELRYVQDELGADDWEITTVSMNQDGQFPANEEEALSLAEIRREHACDFEFYFSPDMAAAVRAEGRKLAARLGLF